MKVYDGDDDDDDDEHGVVYLVFRRISSFIFPKSNLTYLPTSIFQGPCMRQEIAPAHEYHRKLEGSHCLAR